MKHKNINTICPYRILTHPLRGNYGGMLQAWALQKGLSTYSIDVKLADYDLAETRHAFSLRSFVARNLRHIYHRVLYLFGYSYFRMIEPRKFRERYVKKFKGLVNIVYYPQKSPDMQMNPPHTRWIVGSDQVWRAVFTRGMVSVPFYFLDFLPVEARSESFAYAASFGTDEWEGTPEETEACRKLLQQFKSVTVREHSGIKICREVFGVEALQMPDPTLLVYERDYQNIIDSDKTFPKAQPYIAAYILDATSPPLNTLQVVSEVLELSVQHLNLMPDATRLRDRFPISVPQWLRYMKDAEFVVTDSFHGCVFAIIFNKPFVCLGNEGRGSARFDTLFQTFHLESRLAITPEQAVAVAQEPIDWAAVNAIHESERKRGLAFLRENLT